MISYDRKLTVHSEKRQFDRLIKTRVIVAIIMEGLLDPDARTVVWVTVSASDDLATR